MGLLEKRKVQLAALLSCFAANFVPLFSCARTTIPFCAVIHPVRRSLIAPALAEKLPCVSHFSFFFFLFFFPFLSFLTHTLLYFHLIVTSTMLCSSNDQPTLRGSFQKSKCADNRPCVVYIPLLFFSKTPRTESQFLLFFKEQQTVL